MKSPYVNELKPSQLITTSFLVHSKEIRQKKTGELYLSLLLGDRTGELDAKMWDNVTEALDTFDRDDFVKVKGLTQIFHNRPQLTIHKVRRMDDSEIDFADYFPSSRRDPGEMWTELRATVAAIGNGAAFKKGRGFAAWLGVVPGEHSTGGKQKLTGTSRRGNKYLRKLFVQGAHTVLLQKTKQSSGLSMWLVNLASRKRKQVATVALANKMARMAWAVLFKGEAYRPPTVAQVNAA